MELTVDQALQQGVAAQKEGKLQDAERLYRAILQVQPSHPDANHNLGVLAVSVGKPAEAVSLFKLALEANPKVDQFWLSYTDVLIKLERFDEAKRVVVEGEKSGVSSEKFEVLHQQIRTSPPEDKTNTKQGVAASENRKKLAEKKKRKKRTAQGGSSGAAPSQDQLNHLLEHYQSGRFADAEKLAVSLTQQLPEHPLGWKVLGIVLKQTGRLAESLAPMQVAVTLSPQDAEAHNNLGITLQELGRLDEAEAIYIQAIALKPDYAEAHINLGNTVRELGRLDEAEASYRKVISLKPDFADAHYNSGITLQELGRLDEAEASYRQAIAVKPDFVEAHYNSGITLLKLGRVDEAEVSYRKVIALMPDLAEAHGNLGITLKELGRLEEAEASYRQAITLKPDYADAHSNLGGTFKELGRLDEAEASYNQAIALKPDFAEAHSNLGITLKELGRLDEAEASYKQAITLRPDYAEAHYNLGGTLKELGRLDEAEASYKQAIALKPDYADAHSNLGGTLKELGRLDEAEASYSQAIALKPDYAKAHYNLGNTLKELGRLDEAILSYQRSLDLGLPDAKASEAQAHLIHQRCHICDFSVSDVLSATAPKLGISTAPVPPFAALTWADDPEQHLLRAQVYVRKTFKQPAETLPVGPSERPARLKIGYFSADFHNFPGMYLMAGLLESHDRERFEVYAFSYGPDKDDAMRRRIVAAVDHFIDIREMSTQEAVDLSQEHGIDIALHRNGHTKGSRTELFQHRLAPVQISYLGYPGTLGADFIDYLVADPVVIPEEERQYYCEKIIYLPDTYQPNDNTRQISETNTVRADFGLPEEGFVLCCFNQNYKISPREFDIWMRVLGQVEGSVLWLLKSNRWAEENLKKEAEHRGIDPSRVIFAEKIPHAEHLARHKHADLFVDTFNYNAHTTASDALWSGLPIVTKQGRQFASRVAASLLTAVGLPGLITESEGDYERLILELASNPEKLSAIKETLQANRNTEPLFDTQRYTRELEEGLDQAYQQSFEGGQPTDVIVAGTV